MIGKKRPGDVEWIKRNSPKFETISERLKTKWHSYWVFPLKAYRVLSRDGGTSLFILNDRCSSFWPRKGPIIRGTSPVG
jgi:hypothetical protein